MPKNATYRKILFPLSTSSSSSSSIYKELKNRNYVFLQYSDTRIFRAIISGGARPQRANLLIFIESYAHFYFNIREWSNKIVYGYRFSAPLPSNRYRNCHARLCVHHRILASMRKTTDSFSLDAFACCLATPFHFSNERLIIITKNWNKLALRVQWSVQGVLNQRDQMPCKEFINSKLIWLFGSF